MIRRILKSQRGFTLIELLVAVGIMAILAGVAVPVVVKFTSTSQTKSAAAELSEVQVAVDALMADQGLGSLSTGCTLASDANDMSAFPCTGESQPVLYGDTVWGNYMRSNTACTYTVDETGTVSPGGSCSW